MLRKTVWYAKLAWLRLRRDPLSFPGAVVRGFWSLLPSALHARLRGAHSGGRCESIPACTPPDVPGRVSIVLPVFNQADLLGEAIESVLGQTWKDLELIVLDDGSTDDIEPVLTRAAEDPRVRVYRRPNGGLPSALTAGFRFTTGEFVTWTSADNVLEPNMVELLVTRLRDDPGLTMVYADFVVIDEHGAPLRGGDFRPTQREGPDSEIVRLPRDTALLGRCADNFIGPCFLYRSWVRTAFPEWEGAMGVEDWAYWLRLNASFRVEHLGTDDAPYRYRWHGNSLNARAAEIGLLEKARRLLAAERERMRERARPLDFVVDAELADAFVVPEPHRRVSTREGASGPLVVFDGDGRLVANERTLRVVIEPSNASADAVHVPGGPAALGEFAAAWAYAVTGSPRAADAPEAPAPKPWRPTAGAP